jgi:hypothetical protein
MSFHIHAFFVSIPKFGRPSGFDITNVTKERRLKWTGNVARVEEKCM